MMAPPDATYGNLGLGALALGLCYKIIDSVMSLMGYSRNGRAGLHVVSPTPEPNAAWREMVREVFLETTGEILLPAMQRQNEIHERQNALLQEVSKELRACVSRINSLVETFHRNEMNAAVQSEVKRVLEMRDRK